MSVVFVEESYGYLKMGRWIVHTFLTCIINIIITIICIIVIEIPSQKYYYYCIIIILYYIIIIAAIIVNNIIIRNDAECMVFRKGSVLRDWNERQWKAKTKEDKTQVICKVIQKKGI